MPEETMPTTPIRTVLDELQQAAAGDQLIEAMRFLARSSGVYFKELRAQGFKRGEALEMVAAWHDMMYTIQIRAAVGEA